MQEGETNIIQSSNEIILLNKKRNKNKSKNKKKNEQNEDQSNGTTLEIRKLLDKIPINDNSRNLNYQNFENNEIINYNKTINENNLLLLIKKSIILFNTPEYLFMKGKKDSDTFPEEEKYNNYYYQRFYFFSLFDKGIQMDKESWYSVTPEEISEYIASIIPDSSNSVILDPFCGCGGNIIFFSKKFKKVIANDLFIEKINMTKNNTKIYNCPDNIEYYSQDFLKLNIGKNIKIDYIFLSPPWGGPEYKNEFAYSLKKWITPDIDKIIEKCFKYTKNIILYLPRNTDLEELAHILNKYDKEMIESLNNTILFDVKLLKSASKIKAILVLYGPKFNSIKVKLMKEYVISSLFKKNSNKINQNKIKKQMNIMKVIGYSDYVRYFVEYKDLKKDFSGNIFLENLENFFIENVMDDEEKLEYENLNKNNSQNENNITLNIINENFNGNDNKNEKEINPENDFIDLREVLTEEKFFEAQKDIFFDKKEC